jgi:hypothetical protein
MSQPPTIVAQPGWDRVYSLQTNDLWREAGSSGYYTKAMLLPGARHATSTDDTSPPSINATVTKSSIPNTSTMCQKFNIHTPDKAA